MGSAVGSLLAGLLVGVLKYMLQRSDLRKAVLAEVDRQDAHDALAALAWKAQAASMSVAGGESGDLGLRVAPGGAKIPLADLTPVPEPPTKGDAGFGRR